MSKTTHYTWRKLGAAKWEDAWVERLREVHDRLAITALAVTLGVAYIDTDIGKAESAYLLPNFARVKNGKSIAGATVLFSVSAAF